MYHGGLTMAQACGEAPMPALSFIPGQDFDPHDPDDVAAVGLAMDRDLHTQNQDLRAENARLRELINNG